MAGYLLFIGENHVGPLSQNTSARAGNTPIRTTPITLVNRTTFAAWPFRPAESGEPILTPSAQTVLECLKAGGALFYHDIISRSKMLRSEIESAIAELVAAGLLTCDSFAGLAGASDSGEIQGAVPAESGAGLRHGAGRPVVPDRTRLRR